MLKRTPLKAISEKARRRNTARAAQAAGEAAAFRAAILGHRCIVCGRSQDEAYVATGHGHEAHHGVRKEVLKRLGLEHLLWEPGNALPLCEEPCHRRHTRRYRRVLRSELPDAFVAWCRANGLLVALEREYPS